MPQQFKQYILRKQFNLR